MALSLSFCLPPHFAGYFGLVLASGRFVCGPCFHYHVRVDRQPTLKSQYGVYIIFYIFNFIYFIQFIFL